MTSAHEAIARNSLAGWALLDMDRMVEGWASDVVWDMAHLARAAVRY